jgi:hypothetical protein
MEIADNTSLQIGYPRIHLVPSAVHCYSISVPLNMTNIPEVRIHNSIKKDENFKAHETKTHQQAVSFCVSRRMTLRYRTQYICLIPFSSSYVDILSPYSTLNNSVSSNSVITIDTIKQAQSSTVMAYWSEDHVS